MQRHPSIILVLSVVQRKETSAKPVFIEYETDVCADCAKQPTGEVECGWRLTGDCCDWHQKRPFLPQGCWRRGGGVKGYEHALGLTQPGPQDASKSTHTWQDKLYLQTLYKKFWRKSCAKGSFPGALRGLRLEGLEVVGDWFREDRWDEHRREVKRRP